MAADAGDFALHLGDVDARAPTGMLSPLLLLEALTQAAAAFRGQQRSGQEQSGYLVEIVDARFQGGLPVGHTAILSIRETHVLGTLVRFTGYASAGDVRLVAATFTVAVKE